MKSILTGSKEFFQSGADNDVLIIDTNANQIMKYHRDLSTKTCNFIYKDAPKHEILNWLDKESNWWMNFSCLQTKEFNQHFGIDIFNEDKEVVNRIIQKAFKSQFLSNRKNKFMYRFYIHYCFIKNNSYTLTAAQLEQAKAFKNLDWFNKDLLKDIYRFYEVSESIIEKVFE